MLVTRQLTVAIDFNSFFFLLWKSMATANCLKHSGLEQHEGEK